MTTRIEVPLRGVVEQRDGHYAAYVKGLGVTAYGETVEDARARALQMVGIALDGLEQKFGRGYVTGWLTRSDIEWRELSEGAWESSVIHSSDREAVSA